MPTHKVKSGYKKNKVNESFTPSKLILMGVLR